MRRIERATAFKRDYRRAKAISRYHNLDERLVAVLELLINDRLLPPRNRDHACPEIGWAIGTAISGPTSC
jgi:mRNA-degrading endonuclease YafQ of YafQ-DinJ toxin-antitoxin module